jgi:hypothetical protein
LHCRIYLLIEYIPAILSKRGAACCGCACVLCRCCPCAPIPP